MDRRLLDLVHREVEEGRCGVLCTVVDERGSTPRSRGASLWMRPDGSLEGTVGGGLLEHRTMECARDLLASGEGNRLFSMSLDASQAGEEGMVCGGDVRVYLEVLGQEDELVIFGGGHVGRALAQLGAFAGFSVTVWDEREEFANPERIPWGRTVALPLEAFGRSLRTHERTYAVVATRGHSLDGEAVSLLDRRPAAYVGMIGSRSKIAAVRARLRDQGVSAEHLDRVRQPVGLPLRAETPEEIALSVMAEIVAVRRGADVDSLRRGW